METERQKWVGKLLADNAKIGWGQKVNSCLRKAIPAIMNYRNE